MYNFFKELHSGFRYIVFALIIIAIIQAVLGVLGKKTYTEGARKLNLFAMISAHTQLLIGIVLYFISPFVQFTKETMKNPTSRYFTVEHWLMMLIALALITIGHARSKKAKSPEGKHKQIAIYYSLAVLVIVGALVAGHIAIIGR